MKITIVKPDNVVGVNGRFLELDLSSLPDNLHAMQWDADHGHEEWTDKDNTEITSLSAYQHLYGAWVAARDLADALAADIYYGMTDAESRPLRIRHIRSVVNSQTEIFITNYHHVDNNTDYNLNVGVRDQLQEVRSQAEVADDPTLLFPVDLSLGYDEDSGMDVVVTINTLTMFKSVYSAILAHITAKRAEARALNVSIDALTDQELKDWTDPRV